MNKFKTVTGLALGTTLAFGSVPVVFAHNGEAHGGPHGGGGHYPRPKEEPKEQKVAVNIDGGYKPDKIKVHAGREVQLTFKRTEKAGCGDTVKFTELTETKDGKEVPIERTLKTGEDTTITFTPKDKGTLHFTCGMGMYKGSIVVK